MCGIAGFFANAPVATEISNAMLTALRQRGPDAQHSVGWNSEGRSVTEVAPATNALLHARLSIIDPRPISDQPMSNEDGSVWICYNGEVYDWAADAQTLRDQGVVFNTRSDTEFILRAYEAWGIDMLPRLRGMFAIAILDWRQQKLWVVRDRLGLKPLVYTHQNGEFAFGSTVRAVLPFVPKPARQFRPEAIDAYLAHRYIPAPMTIFQGVQRLENAHWLCFDLQTRGLTKREYWRPSADDRKAPAASDWKSTLDDAIIMRTVADRPLGVFLSSGIDSSLVSARLAARGHSGVQSFTAAFDDSTMDESPLAAEIAASLGLSNTSVPIPTSIATDFDQIVADLDEPFADPSAMPSWYLAKATTEHVKVVLGGDGGDEMFAGYKRFAKHLRSHWRAGLRMPLPVAANIDGRGFSKFWDEARVSWRDAYALRFSGFTPAQRRALQPQAADLPAHYWRMPAEVETQSPLKQLLEIDRLNYLPEYILRKADLCTMAHGLELRAPLLDHHWVETVTAMPDDLRFTQPPKALLTQAMPALSRFDLLNRKKKGFNPPLHDWLRKDLAPRLSGIGARLAALTAGQLDDANIDTLCARYADGGAADGHFAEQVLQLLLLDTSLTQLRALSVRLPDRTSAN